MRSLDRRWWKESTVYQIWPHSYKDSNGDGIGDIPGIISTLDYVKELGTEVIWLSPAYASPGKDMGYDISNYEDIDPQYGTLQDAECLIREVHARGMKIIFDLVINHTSDQHEWFKESRSSKDNSKRDWYIWRPAKYDKDGNRKPPNNWRSFFGNSAWEWDEVSQEYYLHLFCAEQPDLNWENETCRRAIYDSAVLFWLKQGIDGFRIDTINMYSKPTVFVDGAITNPNSEIQFCPLEFINGPRMHEFLRELYDVMEPYDTMTVGELPCTPDTKDVEAYVSAAAKQIDMVFQFDVVNLGQDTQSRFITSPVSIPDFKAMITQTQHLASNRDSETWATAFLENHDQARSVSRFGSDDPKWRVRSAKLLATLLATLSGTLFLYQGQELGMVNFPRAWGAEEYRDVETLEIFADAQKSHPNDQAWFNKMLDGAQQVARDHARTPVQWNSSANAGFSASKPWMRVNDDYEEWNAAKQGKDKDSILSFWKEALKVRKQYSGSCVYGRFKMLEVGGEKQFIYVKDGEEDGKLMVLLNFSDEVVEIKGLGEYGKLGEVILGSMPAEKGDGAKIDSIMLVEWEARAYTLE